MNLAHLKYAVEVEKTGSITKAAENLFMGQPNLSKAIKELEAQVGIAIFRRTIQRCLLPTRKGEEFLARAKAILCQIEEMEAIYRPDDRAHSLSYLYSPRGLSFPGVCALCARAQSEKPDGNHPAGGRCHGGDRQRSGKRKHSWNDPL